jgi:hypothetical protein
MSSADTYPPTFAHRDETSFVESIAPEQAHASDDVLRVQPFASRAFAPWLQMSGDK